MTLRKFHVADPATMAAAAVAASCKAHFLLLKGAEWGMRKKNRAMVWFPQQWENPEDGNTREVMFIRKPMLLSDS